MDIRKSLIRLLGGQTNEEAASVMARSRLARMAAEEENTRLRRELNNARREAMDSIPGSSIVAMQNYVQAIEAKTAEQEIRIEQLEKALKISSKKNEDMKKILSMSSIKGGLA